VEHGVRATKWLLVSAFVTISAGVTAVLLAPAHARWAFVAPLAPMAVVVFTFGRGREKTALGEIAVALALSAVAIPVGITAGASTATAVSIAAAFGTLFAASTLGVRVVILKIRGGGDPIAMRRTRFALFALTAFATVGMALAIAQGPASLALLLSVIPGLVLSVALGVRPVPPTRLRTVGWTLVAASGAAAAILMTGLSGVF
jgi:hypothetical protein